MIKEMSIDLETYSDVDISKCGAYKYAESDNFEILLFGVSIDGLSLIHIFVRPIFLNDLHRRTETYRELYHLYILHFA